MDNFYMVLVEGTGSTKSQHETKELAQQEAVRLSKLPANIGKKVFVLQTIAFCQAKDNPVDWTTNNTEE